MRATYQDILTDLAANTTISDFIRDKIRETVTDPETAEKLIPLDHPFATKRPPIDSDYFETYNRPNVDLVDLRATPIEAIDADRDPDDGPALRARHSRVRDRFRRDDRSAAGDEHQQRLGRDAKRHVGGTDRGPTSACRSPASRTCSPSPGRAARLC